MRTAEEIRADQQALSAELAELGQAAAIKTINRCYKIPSSVVPERFVYAKVFDARDGHSIAFTVEFMGDDAIWICTDTLIFTHTAEEISHEEFNAEWAKVRAIEPPNLEGTDE